MALLACPVGSIGMIGDKDLKEARKSFPVHLDGPVYLNGFNDEKTFGADSYFIKSPQGNWLLDSPRFVIDLVKAFESHGGIAYIFISHKDDIGNSAQYAKHFNAKRIINKFDIKPAISDAEIVLDGQEDLIIDKAQIIHTPGHTKGSQVLLWDSKYLFTGDHYAFRKKINAFGSFNTACWYSWKEQISSVEKMKKFTDVEFIYPGHGKRGQIPRGQFPLVVEKSVAWMKTV
jgi:glyoxylase-like metal-dependent hydrolase (beta-lactamase superfamily II)